MSDDVKKFNGKDADVYWDGRLCIHIGECGRAEDDLFVAKRNPWCQPDLVQLGDVVDVVERCPTGAIVYERKDGGAAETPDARNTILVSNHGPLYARGELEIDGAADDMPGVKTRAALCRCGESKNKPFCDNTHEKSGFQDRGAIGRGGGELDSEGGALTIKRAKNGPLLLSGNFTLLAASGQERLKGTKTALCRCGASKNKPFCDGSHSAAGFEAE